MNNYEDFQEAIEFGKYTKEEGIGQVVPESCCILEDTKKAKELFIPKDSNCITTPTTSNSYMNQVRVLEDFLMHFLKFLTISGLLRTSEEQIDFKHEHSVGRGSGRVRSPNFGHHFLVLPL